MAGSPSVRVHSWQFSLTEQLDDLGSLLLVQCCSDSPACLLGTSTQTSHRHVRTSVSSAESLPGPGDVHPLLGSKTRCSILSLPQFSRTASKQALSMLTSWTPRICLLCPSPLHLLDPRNVLPRHGPHGLCLVWGNRLSHPAWSCRSPALQGAPSLRGQTPSFHFKNQGRIRWREVLTGKADCWVRQIQVEKYLLFSDLLVN